MRNYVYLSIKKQKTKQKLTSFLHFFMILILIYYSMNKIVSSPVTSDFDNAKTKTYLQQDVHLVRKIYTQSNLVIVTTPIGTFYNNMHQPLGNHALNSRELWGFDFSSSLPMLKAPYSGDSHLVKC